MGFGDLKFSQKLGMEMMKNCDLPPPQKVFSGSDETEILSMNRVCGMIGREDNGEYEKLELAKVFRLSQMRAREAEKRAESLAKERDSIANVLNVNEGVLGSICLSAMGEVA
ncbi:hypothetical protein HS088_TW05G00062 [Tripterygium wilfordii]|uniref:Uncharacterized protein n=1 Tax=Tripterygium wilfordii TaxID=458696 RepID=A0A7J7DLY2_TRIWF|nr:hypothetical protein HS088_TW05G00062 [Tripterygium wilfordii]